MFVDTPFERCEICRQYVMLDQTRDQCAREHDCTVAECPLKQCFSGEDAQRYQEEATDRVAARRNS